jgi:superfamily II DNA or RNA helicase
MILRTYQQQALDAIRQSVRGGVRRIVAQAPTGAGKTKIAADLAGRAYSKGNRLAFVVPSISLVDQTVEAFHAEGIDDVGVIQANHLMTDHAKSIQVCSIQTVARRGYPTAGAVIFDEVHQLHKAHIKWMQDPAWEKVPFIGLSATPWTKGLGRYFDSLLVVETTRGLIDQGYLSPFRVFATGHPDLTAVKVVAGDYHEGELSKAMQQGELTADIVKTWKSRWGKDKTLCFCVDRAHAQNLQERFESEGVRCGYQDAETPMNERAEIKRKFHSGEYQVITNIGTLTTGVDWDVRCLVLARPTRSEILFVQIIGRALRKAPGKAEALILDHSDTTARLGFVTDIHHEQLSGAKFQFSAKPEDKPRVPLPQTCDSCGMLNPVRFRQCPNCGASIKLRSGIMEVDGELVEIGDGIVLQKAKKAEVRKWSRVEKATFYSELLRYALDHGYKEGWAANKYRARLDVWPQGLPRNPARIISPATAMWIRSQQIAYWKARERQADSQVAT